MKTTIALRHFNAGAPSATLIASIVHPDGNEIELVTLMGNDIDPQTACKEAARELKKLAMRFELLNWMVCPESPDVQGMVNGLGYCALQEKLNAFGCPEDQSIDAQGE